MFLAEADAISKIGEVGLSYGTSKQQNSPNVPAGQVLAITIDDETTQRTGAQKVPAGSTINLVISNGMVQVPDVVGQPISAAQGQLQALQLTVKSVIDQSCGGGNVTSQSGKGEMAQRSTITVTYCGGV
jgi:serine/threonine-protein kinase